MRRAEREELPLGPVDRRRTHEHAADQLRRVILLRAVAPGQHLPAEPDLARGLGVSHVTVKHALRLLEDEGLVTMHLGRGGGAVVRGVPTLGEPTDDLAALARQAEELRDALEVRALVEPRCAERAAQRRTREHLAGLAARHATLVERVDGDDAAFMAADSAFHVSLAALAGNQLLHELVERVQTSLAPALEALPESADWHRRSVDEHAAVLGAVGDGDPERAGAVMAAHVAGTARAVGFLLDTLLGSPGAARALAPDPDAC